jgi:hypothetical protein
MTSPSPTATSVVAIRRARGPAILLLEYVHEDQKESERFGVSRGAVRIAPRACEPSKYVRGWLRPFLSCAAAV